MEMTSSDRCIKSLAPGSATMLRGSVATSLAQGCGGYGHELVAGESRVRTLVSMKTRHVEGSIHVKYVEAQSSHVCEMRKFGEGGSSDVVFVT
ncbi:hypothetical protein TNCV_2858561 [Trichonephila clavipes]|nr:hypothetical protein TNCV_2858561 [Trichonephila clavipes]